MCLDVGRKAQLLTDFLKYLYKNMALLAQKLWRNIFWQNPLPAILRRKKKFLMATKPGGEGVKALVAWPLKQEPFFAALLMKFLGAKLLYIYETLSVSLSTPIYFSSLLYHKKYSTRDDSYCAVNTDIELQTFFL